MELVVGALSSPIVTLILGIAIGYVLRGNGGYGNHGDDNSSMTVTNNITGDYIESMVEGDVGEDTQFVDPPERSDA